jgi:hypothetical protein
MNESDWLKTQRTSVAIASGGSPVAPVASSATSAAPFTVPVAALVGTSSPVAVGTSVAEIASFRRPIGVSFRPESVLFTPIPPTDPHLIFRPLWRSAVTIRTVQRTKTSSSSFEHHSCVAMETICFNFIVFNSISIKVPPVGLEQTLIKMSSKK